MPRFDGRGGFRRPNRRQPAQGVRDHCWLSHTCRGRAADRSARLGQRSRRRRSGPLGGNGDRRRDALGRVSVQRSRPSRAYQLRQVEPGANQLVVRSVQTSASSWQLPTLEFSPSAYLLALIAHACAQLSPRRRVRTRTSDSEVRGERVQATMPRVYSSRARHRQMTGEGSQLEVPAG